MNKYRSHNCNALRKKDVGSEVLLSGWINKKRDHGNLLFIDLRDNYGITQCIIDKKNPQAAARLILPLTAFHNYKNDRQNKIKAVLKRINNNNICDNLKYIY